MKKIAFIGYPFVDKRWTTVFSYWIKKYDLDAYIYPLEIKNQDLVSVIDILPKMGIEHVITDVSCSKSVFEVLDVWTQEAHLSESISHFSFKEGKKYGYNLLGKSIVDLLKERNSSFSMKGKKCVILGNGSVAKSAGYHFLKESAEQLTFIYRHKETALRKLQEFTQNIRLLPWSELNSALQEADIVLNATPLGTKGLSELSVDTTLLKSDCVVIDAVYNPFETPFISSSFRRGMSTIDGLSLLLKRSQNEFYDFFGIYPEITVELRDKMKRF